MLFCIASLFIANAQTSDSPWAVSLGANLVGVQDDSVDSSVGLGNETIQTEGGAPMFDENIGN